MTGEVQGHFMLRLGSDPPVRLAHLATAGTRQRAVAGSRINSMPRNARLGRKHSSPHNPNAPLSRDELEDRIQQAVASWKQNESPNLLSAAKKYGIAHKYSTLRRRAHGLTQSYSNAQRKQRLLTDAQEDGLIQRIQSLDCPILRDTLRSFVNDICGSYPSNNWVTRFRVRHPGIKFCRPPRNELQPAQTTHDLPGDQAIPSPDNPHFTVAADALAGPSCELSALLETSDSFDITTTLTSSDWDFSDVSSVSSISETSMLEFMAEITGRAANRATFPSVNGGPHGLPFFPFARDMEAPSLRPVHYAATPFISDSLSRFDEQLQRQWNAKQGDLMQEDRRVRVHSGMKARNVPQPDYPAPLVVSAPGPSVHPASDDVFHQYTIMSDAAQRTAAWVQNQANQAPSHSTSVARS